MLSDGEHTAPGLMPSTVASLVSDGEVVLHQLVTLKEYIVNTIGGKTKACIVMSMDPVPLAEGAAAPELIGEPIKWDSEEANAAYASQAAEQQSVSPKGPPVSVPSPQTGNLSSRTTSSFSQPSQPYNPAGSSPLLANRCMPIDQLNPYSNRWQIKARVTRKTDLRTFSSAKGDGNFFSMDLSDDSAEIKATAWREVADRLYAMIEVGQTYLISRGQLKVANKKFSTLNNSYELTLNYDTQLQLCADEPITAPKIHYNFCPVGNVAQRS
jgi:replication factor A1